MLEPIINFLLSVASAWLAMVLFELSTPAIKRFIRKLKKRQKGHSIEPITNVYLPPPLDLISMPNSPKEMSYYHISLDIPPWWHQRTKYGLTTGQLLFLIGMILPAKVLSEVWLPLILLVPVICIVGLYAIDPFEGNGMRIINGLDEDNDSEGSIK